MLLIPLFLSPPPPLSLLLLGQTLTLTILALYCHACLMALCLWSSLRRPPSLVEPSQPLPSEQRPLAPARGLRLPPTRCAGPPGPAFDGFSGNCDFSSPRCFGGPHCFGSPNGFGGTPDLVGTSAAPPLGSGRGQVVDLDREAALRNRNARLDAEFNKETSERPAKIAVYRALRATNTDTILAYAQRKQAQEREEALLAAKLADDRRQEDALVAEQARADQQREHDLRVRAGRSVPGPAPAAAPAPSASVARTYAAAASSPMTRSSSRSRPVTFEAGDARFTQARLSDVARLGPESHPEARRSEGLFFQASSPVPYGCDVE
ncbi:unnamed protein product [Ectocarpus sp. CCAP 1310/34]|nr:unnamed protein product [Ectocarpus sp. CCAP 1310/34]